jgi:hypothetical protein
MVRLLHVSLLQGVLFSKFVPCPEELMSLPADMEHKPHLAAKYNYSSWYDFCFGEWGTKWEASNPFVGDATDGYVMASFDTAWSPPIGFYEKMVKIGWEIDADYEEGGQSFRGYFTNEEGDQHFSYDLSTFKKGWEKNFPKRVLDAGLQEEYASWVEDQKSGNTA